MNIVASRDIGLEDAYVASDIVRSEAHPDANIIWGVAFDPELEDEMRITIIATGFEKKPEDATRRNPGVTTNPESPFKKEVKAAPAEAPRAQQRPADAPPVRRVVKPVQKPVADDDFDDLFAMMKNAKK